MEAREARDRARVTPDDIAKLVTGYTYTYATEYDIQAALHRLLVDAGANVAREVKTSAGRIDLTVDRIGIEVKTKGPASGVRSQLARYALTGDFDHLLLITTRSQHTPCAGDYQTHAGPVPVRVVVLNR